MAKGLTQAGADVVVKGRTAAAVENALAKLPWEVVKANIRGVAADVGSAAGRAALVAAQPSVDILVNSVGIYVPRTVPVLGVSAEHSHRNDPLRLHQNSSPFDLTRPSQTHRRHWRNRQCHLAGSDIV